MKTLLGALYYCCLAAGVADMNREGMIREPSILPRDVKDDNPPPPRMPYNINITPS